jgi:phospholipase C
MQVGWLALAAMLAATAPAAAQTLPLLTAQPYPGPAVAPYAVDPPTDPAPSRDALIRLLRKRVKYVFVIFNENHSFDNEYGTFPGANGLFSDGLHPRDAAHTPGFVQSYTDQSGTVQTVRPFRLGPAQNSTFLDSVDHSHPGLARKLHVVGGVPTMQGFAEDEFHRFAVRGGNASVAMGRQFARLVMSYIDCDTIPFFWQYASRFALFDNIFATEDTPSTPNAVAMIAGQAGETQWVRHGAAGQAMQVGSAAGTTQGPPIVNDPQPIWGSQFDTTVDGRQAHGSKLEVYKTGNIASNMTFATMPLTFAAGAVKEAMAQDRAAATDQADIARDIPFIASRGGAPVNWRWYQEGYDHEPTDPPGPASHDFYVSHHSGPQYFGYLSNNPAFAGDMRGEGDFFADMRSGNFPVGGGVFYIRGGFGNLRSMLPPIQNPHFPADLKPADIAAIDAGKAGDDDHPAYSDRQISEAMAARVVNAVAARPEIWSQSAIIITYDESDGFYDHAIPRILSYGPDGLPLARGIRVPMIVISPYARAHVVSHAEGDHNAVLETLEAIYDLPPLASLPDEAQALIAGTDAKFNGPGGFVQKHLGPRDINTPETDDLLSAFEPRRLSGEMPPLPASYATIPEAVVDALPHFGGHGCTAIGVVPEDRRQGISTQVPAGFNPLPATLPNYN